MSRMRPVEVLDQQLKLLKFWKTDLGVNHGEFVVGILKKDPVSSLLISQDWDGYDVADAEAAKLDVAESYWVNDKMCNIIEDASKRMPSQTLLESDLLTDTGFVWFNTPILWSVPSGRENPGYATRVGNVYLQAALWAPVNLSMGDPNTPWAKEERGLVLSFYFSIDKATPHGLPLMIELFPWRFGQGFAEDDELKLYTQGLGTASGPSIVALQRIMATFWTVSQQKVARRHKETDKFLTKKSRKKGRSGFGMRQDQWGNPVYDVEVITLRAEYDRKPKGEEGDGDGFEYTCWFMVESHWQTYHTKDGPRRKLKVEYPKGNFEGPFKRKGERVRALIR